MKATAVEIPESSRLYSEPRDWFDAYEITVPPPNGTLDSWTVCELFLDLSPCWARLLFAVRNAVVRWVGLKTDTMEPDQARKLLDSFRRLREGDFPQEIGVGGANVFYATPQEIVAGADDWHLEFRVSVLVEPVDENKQFLVTLTTVVRFKHWFGRLYFLPVKPFHKLIVRNMLVRLEKRLRTES